MKHEIHGTVFPSLDINLIQGESIFTESGGMAWMRGDIKMETSTRGGLLKGIGRKLAGESFFMTTYTCESGEGMVTFTPEVPGKVLHVELKDGQSLICQKDAFMCAQSTVTLEMHFHKKLGAGLFGGEGFILEKVTGPGSVWFEIPGEVRSYKLAEGEVLKVDPGHIALLSPTVNYSITTVKGVKNIFFSGEGLFLAELTGPGGAWLQSLPVSNLAMKLYHYMPSK